MTEDIRDVVIIGSGPAGLTAAVYTGRANLRPLMLEGEPSSTSDQPGGQLMLTTDVENYPGFPEGIMGPELMANFRSQAERFGAEIQTVKASRVDFSSRPFGVWVGDPTTPEPTHRARSIIVATGAQALMLGLPAEERLLGHGLSTCATCDGFFFREHDIAVIGGGDSALEEAMFLTRFGRTVTIVHRRDSLRASKIMQDRALANDKIHWMWNSVVTDIEGESKVEGLRVRDVVTGEEASHPFTGVFVAIGHRPNTSLFEGQLDMKDSGYLITAPDQTADEHRRGLRLRRRAGRLLPPGDHRGGLRLHGRHRGRTLARGQRALTPSTGHPIHPIIRIQTIRTTQERSMSETISELTEATFFEEVGASDVPVVVDFWAEWCTPCKAIGPILEEIANEQAGKIRVVKLNVDENPGLARQFDVMSIPTLMVFDEGQPKERIVGARAKQQYLEAFAEYL